MASPSTAPSTPENKARMYMNRSFTLPPKLDTTRSVQEPAEIGSAEGVETLFVHPHTSTIKFSTSIRAGRGLSWTSPTETTVAAGSLEVYRVPGSVSFLRSGTLLHAIMPRSQCWCVDGVSKFALRVLQDTYYRIELPGSTQEELELVKEFKKVLSEVLLYERFSCPFERNSGEELPELEDIKNRRLRPEDNAKWLLDRSRLRKTNNTTPPPTSGISRPMRLRQSSQQSEAQESSPERTNTMQAEAKISRVRLNARSITAPPQLLAPVPDPSLKLQSEDDSTLGATDLRTFQPIPTDMPPSPPDSSAGLESHDLVDNALLEASTAHDDVPKTANNVDEMISIHDQDHSNDDSVLLQPQQEVVEDEHLTDVAERIVTEQTQEMHIEAAEDNEVHEAASADKSLPMPVSEPSDVSLSRQSSPEDPFAAIQARILARRSIGGTTSFYPSTVRESTSCSTSSVSSTSAASARSHVSITQQRNMASALVRKACTVFLGPPAHLVAMMLRIAARFANGTFGNLFFVESPSGTSRRIPGSFEIDDDIMSDDLSDDEDDFGVPLHSPIRLTAAKGLRERKTRDAWELD